MIEADGALDAVEPVLDDKKLGIQHLVTFLETDLGDDSTHLWADFDKLLSFKGCTVLRLKDR